ncbi:MAG: hypothetical protein RLZZ262_2192 [Bacteroidota bacterium]|jgi:hypothetical protein
MKKLVWITLIILVQTSVLQAQELNCSVNILLPQQVNSPPSLFETMESTIQEFMNSRKWTKENYTNEERIDCSLQITIEQQMDARTFKASLQVSSSRPVYNSDYKSPVLNLNDRDFQFTFQENTLIQWGLDQHRDNLSSTLAFYAHLIIGLDNDTFSMEGGTEQLLICQTIVTNAQTAPEKGWLSTQEGQQNRYHLIENLLTQTFKPIRECLYNYHRHGMDKMFLDAAGARTTMTAALLGLKNVHKIKPSSYNMQVFFYAKSDEIVNVYKPTTSEERKVVVDLCKLIDPGNISKYDKLAQGS